MSSTENNEDIKYLISVLESEIDLLSDYNLNEELDPASKLFIEPFISHLTNNNKNDQTNHTIDFIDTATKLMSYLTKNGIHNFNISESSINSITDDFISKDILYEPIQAAIESKANKKECEGDIEKLKEILAEVDKFPIDCSKVKELLSQVHEI